MAKIVYHLTNFIKVPNIMVNGLTPSIGFNSKFAKEHRPLICLCDESDIPYWNILLDRDTLLKLIIPDEVELENRSYAYYSELIAYDVIKPTSIEIIPFPNTDEAMADLRAQTIVNLSDDVHQLCQILENEWVIDKFFLNNVKVDCELIHRLHFKEMDKEEVKKMLRKEADEGTFVFTDVWYDGKTRLYEHMLTFNNEETWEVRQLLHGTILEHFEGCLDVDTGGV